MDNATFKLETPWEEVKEKIKERNIDLSDDDLRYEPGQENELLERLARKMNRSVEEVRDYIESVSHNRNIAG